MCDTKMYYYVCNYRTNYKENILQLMLNIFWNIFYEIKSIFEMNIPTIIL